MPGPTRFDGGVETTHIVSAETVKNTGRVFWVSNSTTVAPNGIAGADINAAGHGQSPLKPFRTLDFAIGRCTANRGDTIFIMPNHAETIAGAAGIALDVAGVTVIGLGVGENRPRFTFSATASTFTMGANDTKLLNIIGLPSIDSVVNAFVVTGNDCELGLDWEETDNAIEAITVVRLDTADNAVLNLRVLGRTGGNAMVRCVAVDDTDNARIKIDGYGLVTTAWVNMVDAASTNLRVDGRLFTQGITTGARDVVDTVGGSTWSGEIFDASAGGKFSGGSAAAWASDDITVVATAVGAVADAALADTIEGAAASTQSLITDLKGVLQRIGADNANNTAATTLVGINADGSVLERLEFVQDAQLVGGVDAVTNAQMSDVVGNKTDAAIADTIEGAAATTQSLVADLKAVLQRVGADSANNTAATTLVARNADGSIFERLEDVAQNQVGSAGVASYPAAAAPANAISIAAVLREVYDQSEKAVTNTTAVLANGTTLFTIAGGPIEILSLVARCVTGNDATASTLQWSADPTDGAATTFSAASASLANALAGATVVLQGTTLATAPTLNASGVGLGQQVTNGIVVAAGIITSVIGVGSTTGTWQMHMRYRPLSRGVTVS